MLNETWPIWFQLVALLLQAGVVAGVVSGLFSLLTLRLSYRHSAYLQNAMALDERRRDTHQDAAAERKLWREQSLTALLDFQDEVVAQKRLFDEYQVRVRETPTGTTLTWEWDQTRLVQLLYRAMAFSDEATGKAAKDLFSALRRGFDPYADSEDYEAAVSKWTERLRKGFQPQSQDTKDTVGMPLMDEAPSH